MEPRYRLWHGRAEPPDAGRQLRAGPLTALLDGVDLRYVRVGGHELVRRIHVAVRDHNWATVPGEVSDVEVEQGDEGFAVRFAVRHRAGDLDFAWQGRIEGRADGLLYAMDGEAAAAFAYNRIGICVLHPPRATAGRPYRSETPTGPDEGVLPQLIGPQSIVDGTIYPLFPSFGALDVEAAEGVTLRFRFEGDLFEMEDQRNWTDGSFKTYSTPLSAGFPHAAAKGQALAQRLELTVAGGTGAATPADEAPLQVRLGERLGRTLPAIGLGRASHGEPLSQREAALLRLLRPDHLRAEVRPGREGWEAALAAAVEEARTLETALELVVVVGADAEGQVDALAARLRGAPVARVLVFQEDRPVSDGAVVRLAREHLGTAVPGARFGGGTEVYFTDLNRNRPDVQGSEVIAWSLNPQVHAFDERSVMETPAEQGETVRSARAFCGSAALTVTPVTLLPRFNPNATGPEPEPEPGELPATVDPRQPTLFAAAFTAASAKHLAEAGAAAVTYYETTGWRGVLERESGSPLPERFGSTPGARSRCSTCWPTWARGRAARWWPRRRATRCAPRRWPCAPTTGCTCWPRT